MTVRRAYGGKTVVVTGAAGGLGRALSLRFAEAGARVAALDRDGAAALALADELRAAGHQALGVACDVTDFAACQAAVDKAAAAFGGVDVLVNNAGISHFSLFRETDLGVIRRVMEVNFFGAVHCTKAALARLVERKGQIVVISSIAGFSPLVERTGYSASKHALHGFFDSLRAEVEDLGVDVLVVCPSFVATGIDANALAGDGARRVAPGRKTVGKETSPAEMAALIFEAAAANRSLSLPTRLAKLSWWVSRLSPRTFASQMKRRIAQ